MTEHEDIVIQRLLTFGTLKFYARYVDDTLVLSKPSDIPLILLKLNSFDDQIEFTLEIFTNNNDVHFLNIIITPILALLSTANPPTSGKRPSIYNPRQNICYTSNYLTNCRNILVNFENLPLSPTIQY
jgi:hypothetical protein